MRSVTVQVPVEKRIRVVYCIGDTQVHRRLYLYAIRLVKEILRKAIVKIDRCGNCVDVYSGDGALRLFSICVDVYRCRDIVNLKIIEELTYTYTLHIGPDIDNLRLEEARKLACLRELAYAEPSKDEIRISLLERREMQLVHVCYIKLGEMGEQQVDAEELAGVVRRFKRQVIDNVLIVDGVGIVTTSRAVYSTDVLETTTTFYVSKSYIMRELVKQLGFS